jgi:hypothetical protein
MKVDVRLKHAELPEQSLRHIILAADQRLTSLIMTDAHDEINHAGVEQTLPVFRRKYYLTQGR